MKVLLALILLLTPIASSQYGTWIGTPYCPGNTGQLFAWSNTGVPVGGEPIGLEVIGLDALQPARLMVGTAVNFTQVPAAVGTLCIDYSTVRGHTVTYVEPPYGSAHWTSGLTGQPGQTLYFQVWSRLQYGGSSFSQALEITFQ
jgi:hypothetical protein